MDHARLPPVALRQIFERRLLQDDDPRGELQRPSSFLLGEVPVRVGAGEDDQRAARAGVALCGGVALLGAGEDPGVLVPTAPGLFAPDLVAKLYQKARPAVVRLPVRKAGPFGVTIPTFTRELVPQERAPRTALR